MNYPLISEVLYSIYETIDDNTDISNTVYESVDELLEDIQTYIEEMNDNNGNWIEYLDMHFKKDGNFHTIAMNNQWGTFWDEQVLQYQQAKSNIKL